VDFELRRASRLNTSRYASQSVRNPFDTRRLSVRGFHPDRGGNAPRRVVRGMCRIRGAFRSTWRIARSGRGLGCVSVIFSVAVRKRSGSATSLWQEGTQR